MKPEELMIGDWVMSHNGTDQVQEIYGLAGNVYLKEYGTIDVSKLSPIPITDKILKKNGFVKYNEVSDTPPYDQDEEGNMYYSYKGEQKFWGWWQPNNVYLIPVNAMVDLEIKYVHELQHALRLCGINKEIEI